jgi:nucleoside-diphosphate-sugar epimerase
MANATVLVTGAFGFLGSHLCEKHLKRGDRVVAVDNLHTGSAFNKTRLQVLGNDAIVFVHADVCQDWEAWRSQIPAAWLDGLKLVYHFASPASPPHYQALALETMWVNSIGLRNALEFADTLGARVVFSSTSEIYGDPEVSPQPEEYRGRVNTIGPRSCYDESKRFGEALVYTHNWKKGTHHGMVRIFNTYGPGMNPADGRVVINFLVQALKGSELSIYGHGNQTRSFCFVDDLIAGIMTYADSRETDPINIGNPNEFTVLELAEAVMRLFPGKGLKLRHEDLPMDDPQQRCPDISRAKARLNWEPKISLDEGLKRMLVWLETLPD